MRPVRLGLMGFGRLGRSLFRMLLDRDDIEIAAICEIAEPEALEYLLQFSTISGRLPIEVSARDGHLYAAGKQVSLVVDPGDGAVPWADLGVDVVIEATARQQVDRRALERHLEAGAQRVVLCVPASDPDITIVMGVNDAHLTRQHRIISNGSCTAHCAAPVIKILHRAFGIERVFLSSVHAYSHRQRLADVPAEDLRSGRAAAENIIPQEANSAQVIMGLLPELAGRVSGSAMNVPVDNGSVVDLVCWHEKPVTVTAVNEVVRTAISAHWRDLVAFETEPIVSSDVRGTSYSSVFDAQATMVLGDRVSKTLSWYDNASGYLHRMVELIERLSELDREVA